MGYTNRVLFRRFQADHHEMAGNHEDSLLESAAVAVSWLHPPTPPPAEAQRRRSKYSFTTAVASTHTGARTSGYPQMCQGGGETSSSQKLSQGPNLAHTPPDQRSTSRRRCSSVERIKRGPGDKLAIERNNVMPVACTNIDGYTDRPQRGSPDLALDCGNGGDGVGRKGTTAGWSGSRAGLVARRRTEEILERVMALELSFSRVEEQALGRLRTNFMGGIDRANVGTERGGECVHNGTKGARAVMTPVAIPTTSVSETLEGEA